MDDRVTIKPTMDAAGLAARYEMALQAIVALGTSASPLIMAQIANRALDVTVMVQTNYKPDPRRGI